MIIPGILILIIIIIAARIIFVNIQQQGEFDYHNNITKTIKLWSEDFEQGETIPERFTGLGEELSPSLYWDNIPPETKSLAIIVVDYDAPSPIIKLTTIDHWIVFNIDPDINYFKEAATSQQLQEKNISLGKNITGRVEYVGPNPPIGTHNYYFRIYALSVSHIDLNEPSKETLMDKMKDNIIAYGELVGIFAK